MIFRWLERRPKEPSRGEIMASAFDRELSDLFQMLERDSETEPPASKAMAFVALANINVELRAFHSLNKENQDHAFPTSYTEFGKMNAKLFDKYPPTDCGELEIPSEKEIKFRRLFFFYRAAMLYVVSERAHAAGVQLDRLAKLWITYVDAARYLPALLEHTALWTKN